MTRVEVEREARRVMAALYWASTSASADDATEWAALALQAGFDSDAIVMLAAAPKPVLWVEVEREFREALAGAGIATKDREAALWDYAVDIARDIRDGRISTVSGVDVLRALTWELDYHDDIMPFYVLEDELSYRYGPNAVDLAEWENDVRAAVDVFLQRHSS